MGITFTVSFYSVYYSISYELVTFLVTWVRTESFKKLPQNFKSFYSSCVTFLFYLLNLIS